MAGALCDNLPLLREKLEGGGIQASAPRLAIAHYIFATSDHPTAEDVKVNVEKYFPTVSLATVYNTLNLFVDKGLLKTFRDQRSDQLRYDPLLESHFHFIDEESGKIFDLSTEALHISKNAQVLDEQFMVSSVEVVVKGKLRKEASSKGVKETQTKKPSKKGR